MLLHVPVTQNQVVLHVLKRIMWCRINTENPFVPSKWWLFVVPSDFLHCVTETTEEVLHRRFACSMFLWRLTDGSQQADCDEGLVLCSVV